MADVPYRPFASTKVGGGPVDGYQRTQAPAAAFGATGAMRRATVGLDRAAEALAEEASRQQGMINETLATDAETNFVTQMTEQTSKFQQSQGLQAASELPKLKQTLTELRQKQLDALPNDAVRRSFDLLSKRHLANAENDAVRHADSQIKAADLASALASRDLAVSRAGAADVASDPQRFQDTLGDIDFATQRMMRNRGWGPAMVELPDGRLDFTADENGEKARVIYASLRDKAVGDAWKNRFQVLGDRNVIESYKVYQASKSQIPGDAQADLEKWFEPKILAARAQEEGDKWLGRTALPPSAAPQVRDAAAEAAPPPAARIGEVIFQQESGGNPDAPTSVDGAVGGMQILPATFAQYARPGERIDNPADNRAVGERIIADLTQRYNGDAERVAVAYFSGPGNVAPPGSPTPWLRDVADGNGKTVSAYVGDIVKRMQRSETKMQQAQTLAGISQAYANDPKLGNAVRTYVNQQYQIANIAVQAQERAEREALEAVDKEYTTLILKSPDPTIARRIADDPRLTGEKKRVLNNMLETELSRDNGNDLKTYGRDFYDLWKKVHLPQGDANRITDPTQINNLVGAGLTVAGAAKLKEEIMGKRTPEGEAMSEIKKQFFANAKSQIDGSNDFYKLRDPKGAELFLKFQAQVYPLIEKGIAEGKTAAQMFNPDSPDYVGKAIPTFKRPLAQMMADIEAASSGIGEDAAKTFNPTSVEQVREAYLTRKITRAEAEKILQDKGWARAAAPAGNPAFPAGVAPPISQ